MAPDIHALIRQVREELRERLEQLIASVIWFAPVAKSDSAGDTDTVEGHKLGSGEQSYQYPVRRLWPFGIRSRPPAGVDAVVVKAMGGSSNGVMIGAESARFGPSDLADGETALYSKVNPAAGKLDKDGNTVFTGSDTNGAAKSKLQLKADGTVLMTSNVGGNSATLSFDADGNVVVTPKSGKFLFLGDAAATAFVSLGDKCKAWHDEIKSKYDAHTHDVPGTGSTCVNGSAWTGTATTQSPKSPNASITDKGDCQATTTKVK